MVKVRYEQKPFRREVMRTYGASGRLFLAGEPLAEGFRLYKTK